MSYTVNSSNSGRDNLLALINFTNSTTITNDQISVDSLTTLSGGDIDIFGRNTTVHIAAVDNKGYINGPTAENGIVLKYRRVLLTETAASITTQVSIDDTTTFDAVRAVVAATNGWLVEDVFIQEQVDANAQGTDTIFSHYPDAGGGEGNTQTLTFRPILDAFGTEVSSFVYADSTVVVTGNWMATDPDLGTVVTVTELDGFVPVV